MLHDREGNDVLRVRVPKREPPYAALQWGARFYLRKGADGTYHETECLFLTLSSQYPTTPEEKKRAHLEPFGW